MVPCTYGIVYSIHIRTCTNSIYTLSYFLLLSLEIEIVNSTNGLGIETHAYADFISFSLFITTFFFYNMDVILFSFIGIGLDDTVELSIGRMEYNNKSFGASTVQRKPSSLASSTFRVEI